MLIVCLSAPALLPRCWSSRGCNSADADLSAPAASQVLVIEGLHPFFDDRVADLLDFKIYLDISDDVKFAWKIQRDMAERGHSLESIKASIESRKPDFDAFIDPQKQKADVIIQARCVSSGRHPSSPKPIGHTWSYLPCRRGHLVPIWQLLIGSSCQ
jgi:phosphoribulokinase